MSFTSSAIIEEFRIFLAPFIISSATVFVSLSLEENIFFSTLVFKLLRVSMASAIFGFVILSHFKYSLYESGVFMAGLIFFASCNILPALVLISSLSSKPDSNSSIEAAVSFNCFIISFSSSSSKLSTASSVTASMRRRPAATEPSLTILNNLISEVLFTCVPPHSSFE